MNKKIKLDSPKDLPYDVVIHKILPFVIYGGEPSSCWPAGATMRPKYLSVNKMLFYGYFERDFCRKTYFLWESVVLYSRCIAMKFIDTLNKNVNRLSIVDCELAYDKEKNIVVTFENYKYLYVDTIRKNWFITQFKFKNITTLVVRESEQYVRTLFDQIEILIFDVSVLNLREKLPEKLQVLYIENCDAYLVPNAKHEIDNLTRKVPTLIIESDEEIKYKRIDKKNGWVKKNIKDCSKKDCKNIVVINKDVDLDFGYCKWCESYYCYECCSDDVTIFSCESCKSIVCNDCIYECNVCIIKMPGWHEYCYDCVYPCKECNGDICRSCSKYCSMCDKEDDESNICKLCRKKCIVCKRTRCKKHIDECCK
jgi:hypothetical protein